MDNDENLGRGSEADVRRSGGTLMGSLLSLKNPYPTSLNGDSTSLSIFGDGACGDPLMAQHLVIDFTPDEEVDTEFVQKKCCAFWEFINSHPELNHMCVTPEPNQYMKMPEESVKSSSTELPTEMSERMDTTAVSMLSLLEHKDMANSAFAPKTCQTHCTLGPREYIENEASKPVLFRKCVCGRAAKCSKPCKPGRVTKEPATADTRPDVQNLCKTMYEWDAKHPKSMKPPGPVPTVIYAKMQRKIERYF